MELLKENVKALNDLNDREIEKLKTIITQQETKLEIKDRHIAALNDKLEEILGM